MEWEITTNHYAYSAVGSVQISFSTSTDSVYDAYASFTIHNATANVGCQTPMHTFSMGSDMHPIFQFLNGFPSLDSSNIFISGPLPHMSNSADPSTSIMVYHHIVDIYSYHSPTNHNSGHTEESDNTGDNI